jgi:hypothetical protein
VRQWDRVRHVSLALAVFVAGCEIPFPLVARAPDAAPIDAAVDAAPSIPCPAGYGMVVGESTRYRFVTPAFATTWKLAEAACEADDMTDKITHLAVPDTLSELTHLRNGFGTAGETGNVWIGVARNLGDADVKASFFDVTGNHASDPLWEIGQPTAGLVKTAVTITAGTQFANQDPSQTFGYVCECDGIAPRTFNF